MARIIKVEMALDDKELDAKLKQLPRKFKSALDAPTASINSLRSATSGLTSALGALVGIAAFKQIAQFGIDLDKARNTMTALTGSVAAANAKLAELRELAKASPGVTNTFATQLFNQLKAIGGIGDEVINKVIKSLGKLNTVFAGVGPEFSRNLVQIFQQGFERSDIKEALGRIPIFEQLLQTAFGTNDPDKLRKLKASGALTMEGFLTGVSEGIEKRFPKVQESLGGRFEKTSEEIKLRLGELGEKILRDLLPAVEKLTPVILEILRIFTGLPGFVQASVIAFAALPGPVTSVARAITGLAASFTGLGAAGASPGFARILAFLGTPIGAVTAAGGAAALGVALSERDLQQRLEAERQVFATRGGRLDLAGNPIFAEAPKDAKPLTGKLSLTALQNAFDPLTGQSIFGPIASSGRTGSGGGASGKAAKEAQKTAVDLLFFAKSREFDLAAGQKAIDESMKELSRQQLEGGGASRPAQLAGFNAANAERIRKIELESLKLEEATAKKALDAMEKIEPVLSNSERLMRGFGNSVDTVGDAFERFGNNIARSFNNVKDLFNGLKQAVLGFFNDILGSALQNIVRGALGPLFGGGGGGGGLGNLFRTPSTFPSSVSGGAVQSATGAIGGSGGILGRIFGGGGGTGGSAGGFSLGGALGSLASAAPFLGLGLGSALGGQSTAGNILGAIGGGAVGLGVSFGASVFGAGGGLAAAGLAALGPAALIGAPLLVGAVLLGKAKQRKKDEEASGQMLTQALQALTQLRDAIGSDQIDGSQASAIFENNILGQFRSGINTLKTKSVRDSRLTNQVNDLRRVYEDIIPAQIAAQSQRRNTAVSNALTHSKLIPEFATGGITGGGLALLHANEMVLTVKHQRDIQARAGAGIFNDVGVPGVQPGRRFDNGGLMPSVFEQDRMPAINISLVIGKEDQTKIVVNGGNTMQGRLSTVKNVRKAQKNREL
jgi:hypothetical protein